MVQKGEGTRHTEYHKEFGLLHFQFPSVLSRSHTLWPEEKIRKSSPFFLFFSRTVQLICFNSVTGGLPTDTSGLCWAAAPWGEMATPDGAMSQSLCLMMYQLHCGYILASSVFDRRMRKDKVLGCCGEFSHMDEIDWQLKLQWNAISESEGHSPRLHNPSALQQDLKNPIFLPFFCVCAPQVLTRLVVFAFLTVCPLAIPTASENTEATTYRSPPLCIWTVLCWYCFWCFCSRSRSIGKATRSKIKR